MFLQQKFIILLELKCQVVSRREEDALVARLRSVPQGPRAVQRQCTEITPLCCLSLCLSTTLTLPILLLIMEVHRLHSLLSF